MSPSPSDEEFLEAVGAMFGGQTQHIAAVLLKRKREKEGAALPDPVVNAVGEKAR